MKVSVGDKAPDFTLKDKSGNIFHLAEKLGYGPLVIYFYPKDGTPGCTTQACAYRDSYQDFKDAGAEVIGISSDHEESHLYFASRYSLPFILLSDDGGKVRKLFGVPRTLGLLPGRVTYVLDGTGVVRYIFNSQSKVKEHAEKALEMIRTL